MFLLLFTLDRNFFNFFFFYSLILYLPFFFLFKHCVCETDKNFFNLPVVIPNKEYSFNDIPIIFGKTTTLAIKQNTQKKFSVADDLKKSNNINEQLIQKKTNSYENAINGTTTSYWTTSRKPPSFSRLFLKKRRHEKNKKLEAVENVRRRPTGKETTDTTLSILDKKEHFDKGVHNSQNNQFQSSNISFKVANDLLYIQLKSSNITKLNEDDEKLVAKAPSHSLIEFSTTQSTFYPSNHFPLAYEDEKLRTSALPVKKTFSSILRSKEYVVSGRALNQLRQLQAKKTNISTQFFSLSPSSLNTKNTTSHTVEGLGLLPLELFPTTRPEKTSEQNFPNVSSYTPHDFFFNDEPVATRMISTGATPFPGENIFVYCYPFNERQIVEKCSAAKDFHAVGVYVPMMMEVQIKHEMSWYSELRRLKRLTNLKIVGIAYEMPNWDLIVNILLNNPQLFDGVLIEWVGRFACIAKMPLPTLMQLSSIKSATRSGILRYLVNEQNYDMCNTSHIEFLGNTMYTNLKTKQDKTLMSMLQPTQGFTFPSYIQPVFACMGGQEGFCYKAFKSNPVVSCSSNQRYIFNPYEYVGGRMLHLLNETCHGLPSYDLYGVV